MRITPLRLIIFLLSLSLAFLSAAFVSAQLLRGFTSSAEIDVVQSDSLVCSPDLDCRISCNAKARRVYEACLDAGHPSHDCRERSRAFRRACIDSECRPTLGCEDRCKAHGKRLLHRCLEDGGEIEVCREEAASATAACIEQNCRDCVCPDIYDPVCGVDGMTYGNACEASCAGVRVAHEGVCEPKCEPLPCDVFCEFGHKIGPDGCPTCECNPPPGCRDDTDCDDDQICIEICTLQPCILGDPHCGDCVGICLPEPDICLCPEIWDPVCGADGVTYGNSCQAGCAGVDVVSSGECGGGVCPNQPVCRLYCPDGYAVDFEGCPICSCDLVSIGEPSS